MAYIGINTITDAENELAAMMHGSSINQIQNIYGVFNRAARRVVTDVDPWETKMNIEMGTVYDDVFDYACPIDLKGNKVIDIHPQVTRTMLDNYSQKYNRSFDVNKQFPTSSQFTLASNGGERTLRVNTANMFSSITMDYVNQIVGNGTFVVGGNAVNLREDNLYRTMNTNSSLAFDLKTGVAGSTGYIENSTMTPMDLTAHLNQAVQFLYAWFPNSASITSIELRWGSDSTNYWSNVVTVQQTGDAFRNGWNLAGFLWNGAIKVGNPDITKMTYMRATFTYDGTAQTAIRVNDYESRLGQILMLEYYSKYLFRDKTNKMIETVGGSTDKIQLDTDAYDLWLMAAGSDAVQQMQGLDALFFDNNHFAQRYINSLSSYRAKYKSEIIKPNEVYYKMPNPSRLRWIGRKWNQ